MFEVGAVVECHPLDSIEPLSLAYSQGAGYHYHGGSIRRAPREIDGHSTDRYLGICPVEFWGGIPVQDYTGWGKPLPCIPMFGLSLRRLAA